MIRVLAGLYGLRRNEALGLRKPRIADNLSKFAAAKQPPFPLPAGTATPPERTNNRNTVKAGMAGRTEQAAPGSGDPGAVAWGLVKHFKEGRHLLGPHRLGLVGRAGTGIIVLAKDCGAVVVDDL